MQMQIHRAFLLIFLFSIFATNTSLAEARWGAKYFPDVTLTNHRGEKVKFFEDLIKDKVVAINFIYTSCPDTCPLETAQLIKVQNILNDRIGKDVFIYSISIDPDVDTPEVLKKYREKFGAKWDFFTGNELDIIKLRKKLGLYIEEIQDGSNNHNVSMIIGNQKTGRWMKRSPFENPHVLADQLGNWLTGWKAKQKTRDYADAPELRSISRGEQLYRTRCSICHTVTGKELANAVGPDLLGVTRVRDKQWLFDWLKAPDQMLAKKDPIAMALYEKYDRVAMPNMRLNQMEAIELVTYIEAETTRLSPNAGKVFGQANVQRGPKNNSARARGDLVAVMNAWVREPIVESEIHAGYLTLLNVNDGPVSLISISTNAYEQVEIHEMTHVDGLMKMAEVESIDIPANGRVSLKPGGKHLMLISPNRTIKIGGTVRLKLKFKSGRVQIVDVPIKKQ